MGNNNSYVRKSYLAQDFSQPPYMPSKAKLHRSTSEYRNFSQSSPQMPRYQRNRHQFELPENKVMHENPAFGMEKLRNTGKLEIIKNGGTLRVINGVPVVDETVDELIQKLNNRSRLLVKSEWAMKRSNSVGDLVESSTNQTMSEVNMEIMARSYLRESGSIKRQANNGPPRKSRKKTKAPPPPSTNSQEKENSSNFVRDKKNKKNMKKGLAPNPPALRPSQSSAASEDDIWQGSLEECQSYQSMISIRTADIEDRTNNINAQQSFKADEMQVEEKELPDISKFIKEEKRDPSKAVNRESFAEHQSEQKVGKHKKERKAPQRSDSVLAGIISNLARKHRKGSRSKSAENRINEEDDPTKGFVLRKYSGSSDDVRSEFTEYSEELFKESDSQSRPQSDHMIEMSMKTPLTEKILQHLREGDYRIKDIKSKNGELTFVIDQNISAQSDVSRLSKNVDEQSLGNAKSKQQPSNLQPPVIDRTSEWVRQAMQFGDKTGLSREPSEAVINLSSESDSYDSSEKGRNEKSPPTELSDLLTSSASSFAWAGRPLSIPPANTSSPERLHQKVSNYVNVHLDNSLGGVQSIPLSMQQDEISWTYGQLPTTSSQDQQQSCLICPQNPTGDTSIPLPEKSKWQLEKHLLSEDDGYNSQQQSPASSSQLTQVNSRRSGEWTPEMDLNGELDDTSLTDELSPLPRLQHKPVLSLQSMFTRGLRRDVYSIPNDDQDSLELKIYPEEFSKKETSSDIMTKPTPSVSFVADCVENEQKKNSNSSPSKSDNSKVNKMYSFKKIQQTVKDAWGNRKYKKTDEVPDDLQSNWIMRQSFTELESEKERGILHAASDLQYYSEPRTRVDHLINGDFLEPNLRNKSTLSDSILNVIPQRGSQLSLHNDGPQSGQQRTVSPKWHGNSSGHVIYLPEAIKFEEIRKVIRGDGGSKPVHQNKIINPAILEEEIAKREMERDNEKKMQDEVELNLKKQREQDRQVMQRQIKQPHSSERSSEITTCSEKYENIAIVKKVESNAASSSTKEFSNPNNFTGNQAQQESEPLYQNSAVEKAAICIGDLRKPVNEVQIKKDDKQHAVVPVSNKAKDTEKDKDEESSESWSNQLDNILARIQNEQQRDKSIEAWIRHQRQSVGLKFDSDTEDIQAPAMRSSDAAVFRGNNHDRLVPPNVLENKPITPVPHSQNKLVQSLVVDGNTSVTPIVSVKYAPESADAEKEQFFFGMEKRGNTPNCQNSVNVESRRKYPAAPQKRTEFEYSVQQTPGNTRPSSFDHIVKKDESLVSPPRLRLYNLQAGDTRLSDQVSDMQPQNNNAGIVAEGTMDQVKGMKHSDHYMKQEEPRHLFNYLKPVTVDRNGDDYSVDVIRRDMPNFVPSSPAAPYGKSHSHHIGDSRHAEMSHSRPAASGMSWDSIGINKNADDNVRYGNHNEAIAQRELMKRINHESDVKPHSSGYYRRKEGPQYFIDYSRPADGRSHDRDKYHNEVQSGSRDNTRLSNRSHYSTGNHRPHGHNNNLAHRESFKTRPAMQPSPHNSDYHPRDKYRSEVHISVGQRPYRQQDHHSDYPHKPNELRLTPAHENFSENQPSQGFERNQPLRKGNRRGRFVPRPERHSYPCMDGWDYPPQQQHPHHVTSATVEWF